MTLLYRSLLMCCLLLPAALAAQDMPPARVVTAAVTEGEVQNTSTAVGVLRFARVSEVAAEVEGLITAHHFDTGTVLAQGQVMVELNTDFVRQDMAINRSEAKEVNANIEKLARELKRLESLAKDNLASRSAQDVAYYDHKSLQKRRDTLNLQLERLSLHVDKSQVRAPFDGIVLEKNKELGDWVTQGASVARLGATDFMHALLPVAESLAVLQQGGAELQVRVPALGRSVTGTVLGMVPVADQRSKSVSLKVLLPYEQGMLENATAEADLPTSTARRLRLVPRGALLQAAGQDTVYVVTDGKAQAVNVTIRVRNEQYIGVDDDTVQVGMQVVVEGNDRLQPGQAVEVVESLGAKAP